MHPISGMVVNESLDTFTGSTIPFMDAWHSARA